MENPFVVGDLDDLQDFVQPYVGVEGENDWSRQQGENRNSLAQDTNGP